MEKTRQLVRSVFTMVLAMACGITRSFGQSGAGDSTNYEDLSLKELLNVKIVSVSKNVEALFDAPLSASVVTRDEIRRAGCTSIMEALRLAPGMIVREQSNGNYDIHIRGMDNITPNASFDKTSTTMLVMIDNRPIYSFLRGGTFWETLPVDINDVEKIEIIRGPAGALYGPNAVNGVINIITREAKKKGLYLVSNAQHGSNRTTIINSSIGYKSNNWQMIASGNYQRRNRSQTSYYGFTNNEWVDDPKYLITFHDDTATNINQRYPDPELAMEKYAGNVFLNYNPTKKARFSIGAGLQYSMVQKVSSENEITPLSTASSDSRYFDLRANVAGFSAQVLYNAGIQNVDYDPGNKYDFSKINATVEYNYSRGNFSLKPGLSYQAVVYDDTKYSDIVHKTGIFNTRGSLSTKEATLRAEYKLMKNKLRLVAGLSSNTFDYPDSTYISMEFAATYKATKNNLFRAVFSRAPRSSNVFDTYVDQTIAFFPIGYKKFSRIGLFGNKELSLLSSEMFELGYRGKISSKLNVDVEVFDVRAKNTNILISSRPYNTMHGSDTIVVMPIIAANLPLKFVQQGITISLHYSTSKLQVKPFVTLQHSRIKNYAPFNNSADAAVPGAELNNIHSGMGKEIKSESTPGIFGGAYVNYAPVSKLNINLNTYYYGKQHYQHLSNTLYNDGVRGIDNIRAKLILNASVSYEVTRGLYIFCTGKNLLDNRSHEFYRTDNVPLMLLTGLNYEF